MGKITLDNISTADIIVLQMFKNITSTKNYTEEDEIFEKLIFEKLRIKAFENDMINAMQEMDKNS